MRGQKVMVPLTYPGTSSKKVHAEVIGAGVYIKTGQRWVDVQIKGKPGAWRERFFREDVK